MKKTVVLSCLAAAALAWGSTASAAENWIGTWKLNVAQSKFSPGPGPKSQTIKFEKTADGIKVTSDGVNAEGKEMHGGFASKWDGKEVPWTGNPNADTAAPKGIDDNSYENTWTKDGKVTITSKAVVSGDGKTLTITQAGKNAKGEAVSSTAVYDRQ